MNRKNARTIIESLIEKPAPTEGAFRQEYITPPMVIDATPKVVQAEVLPDPVVLPKAGWDTISADSCDNALRSWKRTKQWFDNTTLRGINPHRLEAVIAARVEAAFRAGYAAGVGDSI